MAEDLESRVKKYESLANVKAYLVDTTARMLFYIPAIAAWEKYVAHFDNDKLVKSRLIAIGVNVIFGRFHGKVREYVSSITHTIEKSSRTRKFINDSIVGTTVGLMSYPLVLYAAGVTWEKGKYSLPFVLALAAFTGRPFGSFVDWYRNIWGTTPVYKQKSIPPN